VPVQRARESSGYWELDIPSFPLLVPSCLPVPAHSYGAQQSMLRISDGDSHTLIVRLPFPKWTSAWSYQQMRDVVAVDDDRAEILLISCLHGRCRKADELAHVSSPF